MLVLPLEREEGDLLGGNQLEGCQDCVDEGRAAAGDQRDVLVVDEQARL